MGTKARVPGPDGEPVDATEIGFRTGAENFNEYLLDDGSVIKIKLVVTRVLKIDDFYLILT